MGNIKRATIALSSDLKPLRVEFKTQSSVNSFFGTREGSVTSANEILELKTDYTQEVGSLHVSTSRAVKNNFNYKIGYNKDVKIRLNNLGFYPDGNIADYDFKLSIFSDVGTFTLRSNPAKTLFVLEHPYGEDRAVASTNYAYGTLDVSKFDFIFQANSIQIMIDSIVIVTVTGIKQPTKFEGFEFYINNLNQGLGFSSVSLSNIEVTATANGVNFSSLENLPNLIVSLNSLGINNGFLKKQGDNIVCVSLGTMATENSALYAKLNNPAFSGFVSIPHPSALGAGIFNDGFLHFTNPAKPIKFDGSKFEFASTVGGAGIMTIFADSGVAIGTTINSGYKFNVVGSSYFDGPFYINHNLNILGADLKICASSRGSGGRAMVHESGNRLFINYSGDFTGGVCLDGKFILSGRAVFADNTAAASLTTGEIYRRADGVLCIKY